MNVLVALTHRGYSLTVQGLQGVKNLLRHALIFHIGVLLLHNFLYPFCGQFALIVLITLDNALLLSTFELLLKDFQRMARIALPLYLRKQMAFPSQEKRVLEDLVVAALSFGLVKVIHIELPDKRGEVVVFEILWKDFLAK